MSYYGIYRNKPDDEICHFKYIKRIKTSNGKYRYIYDDSELKKYESGHKEVKNIKRPESPKKDRVEITSYTRGNQLKDSTKTYTNYKFLKDREYGPTPVIETVKTQGKLSTAAAKGEKILYDKVLTKVNKGLDKADKAASKGKTTVDKLNKKLYNKMGGDKKVAYEEAQTTANKTRKSYMDAQRKSLDIATKSGFDKADQNMRVRRAYSTEALNRFGNSGKLGGSTTSSARTEKIVQKQRETLDREYDKVANERDRLLDESYNTSKAARKAKEAYEDTPLYKIERRKANRKIKRHN